MAGKVSAAAIWDTATVTSTAGEVVVTFPLLSGTGGWVNVHAFSRLTVRFENGDTAANTVTVETRVHPDQAVGIDRYGPTAQSTDGVVSILDKADIMNVHSFRVLENGAEDTHIIHILAN